MKLMVAVWPSAQPSQATAELLADLDARRAPAPARRSAASDSAGGSSCSTGAPAPPTRPRGSRRPRSARRPSDDLRAGRAPIAPRRAPPRAARDRMLGGGDLVGAGRQLRGGQARGVFGDMAAVVEQGRFRLVQFLLADDVGPSPSCAAARAAAPTSVIEAFAASSWAWMIARSSGRSPVCEIGQRRPSPLRARPRPGRARRFIGRSRARRAWRRPATVSPRLTATSAMRPPEIGAA